MFGRQISIAVFAYVLIGTVIAVDDNFVFNPPQTNCGRKFNNEKGTLAFNGKKTNVPEDVTCIWTINTKNDEIFLDFEYFILFENDSFVIKNTDDDKVIFGPYSGYQGRFIIGTGTKNITAELKTSPIKYSYDRSFLVQFSTKECKIVLSSAQSGSLSSPVYNYNRNTPLNCQYSIHGFGTTKMFTLAITLSNLTLNNGALNISSTQDHQIYTSHDGNYFPSKIYSKGRVEFDIQLNASSKFDYFKLYYEIVPDSCSGRIDLDESDPSRSVSFLTPKNPTNSIPITMDNVHCDWLVTSPPGSKIRVNFPVLELKSFDDQLVLSSSLPQFHPLLLSSHNHHLFKDKAIVSPSNEFWVKYNSLQNFPGTQFRAQFSILKEGDLNENTGSAQIITETTEQATVTYPKTTETVEVTIITTEINGKVTTEAPKTTETTLETTRNLPETTTKATRNLPKTTTETTRNPSKSTETTRKVTTTTTTKAPRTTEESGEVTWVQTNEPCTTTLNFIEDDMFQTHLVESAHVRVSLTTMLFSVAGVIVAFAMLVIASYFFQRRQFQKKYTTNSRWESLSNPSYQSDKDIVSI